MQSFPYFIQNEFYLEVYIILDKSLRKEKFNAKKEKV